jgi:hypothetical protein
MYVQIFRCCSCQTFGIDVESSAARSSAEQQEIVDRNEASSSCLRYDDRRVKGERLQQQLVGLRMNATTLRHAARVAVTFEQAESGRSSPDDVLAELVGEGVDGRELALLVQQDEDTGGTDCVLMPSSNCINTTQSAFVYRAGLTVHGAHGAMARGPPPAGAPRNRRNFFHGFCCQRCKVPSVRPVMKGPPENAVAQGPP